MASIGTSHGLPSHVVCVVSSSIISLERNPLKSGIPAIDSEATMAIAAVIGIRWRRPPSRRKERVCVS